MPMVKPVMPLLQQGHPLAQGLIACWPMAEMEDRAPVKTISPNAVANGLCYGFTTSGRVATPYGAGVRQNNDGGYIYTQGSPIYAPVNGKFTYAILARFNNPLANYGNISRNYTNNTGFTFHFGGTTGQLRLTIGYGAGTFNWFSSGSPVIEADRWYMLGFSFDGNPGSGNGPLYWWYDGVPRLINSSAAYFAPSTTVFRPVSDNLNGDVAGAWMWGRHLSVSDWQMLMYDPFAMVRPKQRIFTPAPVIIPTNDRYLRWFGDTPKVITGNGTATIAIGQRAILTISHRNKTTFSMAEVPRFTVPAGVNIRPLAVFSDDEFTVEIENVSCVSDIAYSWSRRGIL